MQNKDDNMIDSKGCSGKLDGVAERAHDVPEKPDVPALCEPGQSSNGAPMPGLERIIRLVVRPTEPGHEETRDIQQRVHKRGRIDSVVPFLADHAVRHVRLRDEHVGERIAPGRARSFWNSARSKPRVKP